MRSAMASNLPIHIFLRILPLGRDNGRFVRISTVESCIYGCLPFTKISAEAVDDGQIGRCGIVQCTGEGSRAGWCQLVVWRGAKVGP